MIIQFCGLSGSGKTTLANNVRTKLGKDIAIEIIDGDEYRKNLCSDLGFSKADRATNIRRLSFVAGKLAQHSVVSIICAINPYREVRNEVLKNYPNVKTVFVDCSLPELIQRDTKGLYRKALLPDGHNDKITNLTGVNDPFERPHPYEVDLLIQTDKETIDTSTDKLAKFILESLNYAEQNAM